MNDDTNEDKRKFLIKATGGAVSAVLLGSSVACSKKDAATNTKVTVNPSEPVTSTPPPKDSKWTTVTIELTPDQIKQLAELGVDTTQISIQTFDIKRLGTVMPN